MARIDAMDPAVAELVGELQQTPAHVAHTKRFMERFQAEPDFRAGYDLSPAALPVQYGELRIGAEELAAYQELKKLQLRYRALFRSLGAASNPRIKAWRERQILRARWELGESVSNVLVHAPVCFELSRGCTVKCWFCGVAAEPFEGNLRYDEESGTMWRATLAVLRELLGPAAAHSFLYWATDPFDNPDYEKFMCDFQELLGMWPQTTTAIPLRDVARTRAFLQLTRERKGLLNRFSVLSRSIFHRIFEEFSPEELLHVELIPQFNNDVVPKAMAGAARERALRKSAGAKDEAPATTESGGTIACVSGFLFNMAERRVRLISPCRANSRFPLGYIVFRDFHFTDASDLRSKLEDTIATSMPLAVPRDMPLRFLPCLRVEYPETGGFLLRTAQHCISFAGISAPEDLARRVEQGVLTAAEIATARMLERHIDPVATFWELNQLFAQGVLVEETALGGDAEALVPIRLGNQPAALRL